MKKYLQLSIGGFDSNGSHWTDSFCFEIDDTVQDLAVQDCQNGVYSIEFWVKVNYVFGNGPNCVNEVMMLEINLSNPEEDSVLGKINTDCIDHLVEYFKSGCLNFKYFKI